MSGERKWTANPFTREFVAGFLGRALDRLPKRANAAERIGVDPATLSKYTTRNGVAHAPVGVAVEVTAETGDYALIHEINSYLGVDAESALMARRIALAAAVLNKECDDWLGADFVSERIGYPV